MIVCFHSSFLSWLPTAAWLSDYVSVCRCRVSGAGSLCYHQPSWAWARLLVVPTTLSSAFAGGYSTDTDTDIHTQSHTTHLVPVGVWLSCEVRSPSNLISFSYLRSFLISYLIYSALARALSLRKHAHILIRYWIFLSDVITDWRWFAWHDRQLWPSRPRMGKAEGAGQTGHACAVAHA